jgi:DNA-binding MarR family transcriptional regulator
MTDATPLPFDAIFEVRDVCLCLAVQRAARRIARRFDRAFQTVGLTNGQFSALMFVAGAESQTPGRLADLLGMDRTTVTALLKALQRRRLVEPDASGDDRRQHRVAITPQGRALLAAAMPIWREAHARLEAALPPQSALSGRGFLRALSATSITSPAPAPSETCKAPQLVLRARRRRHSPAAA